LERTHGRQERQEEEMSEKDAHPEIVFSFLAFNSMGKKGKSGSLFSTVY